MNKLVYLYELDSVRNSTEEIELGQQALFEEIVVNGNQVVITFNQLTDSEAFLSAVKDEKTYNEIIELFKIGTLKVSRFNNIRTASQYIQNSIDKCMQNNSDSFIFSGLPVAQTDVELLKLIKNALQYSDPAILEDYLSTIEKNGNETDINRIQYIIRFVKLILSLSTEASANNPAKLDSKKTFMEFFDKIGSSYLQYGITNKEVKDIESILSEALVTLQAIKAEFITNNVEAEANRLMNNRSNWVKIIQNMPGEPKVYMAEAVIDLCYNYTMEESIFEVSKHYLESDNKMFWNDFQNRLTKYWKLHTAGIHKFNAKETTHINERTIQLPDWSLAVRIVKNKKNPELKATLYETNYEKEKRAWKRTLYKAILKRCGVAIIYVALFCLVQYIMGILQTKLTFEVMNWEIISSILNIVVFGILGTLVSNWLKLPDILDSIKNIGTGVYDFFKYKFIKKGIAYKNNNKGDI